MMWGSAQVMELAGVSYRQVDYWCRRGWLGAGHGVDSIGSGYSRVFTADELRRVLLLAAAFKAGLGIAAVAAALDDGAVHGPSTAVTVRLSDAVTATLAIPCVTCLKSSHA